MPDYAKDIETVRHQFDMLQAAGEALAADDTEYIPEVAVLEDLPDWIADSGTQKKGTYCQYNGNKYYTSTDILRIENYNPEAAPNNYYLIPTPVGGIYPYVMRMMCKRDMLIKDPNGKVYKCTLTAGATYKLVNEPSTAASIFVEADI